MTDRINYDVAQHDTFAGIDPRLIDLGRAQIAVLPIPFESSGSWSAGSRRAPVEIIRASTYMDWWDEELRVDIHDVGIHTLPFLPLPAVPGEVALDEVVHVASAVLAAGKFLVVLGGDGALSSFVVAAAARSHPGLTVLHLGAHANLRDAVNGARHHDACGVRRVLERASCTQVGIRSLSKEETSARAGLRTTIFFDSDFPKDDGWRARVVDSLGADVYVTVDCSVLSPSVMPAVARPEPGGLTWLDSLALLRTVFERRSVVACDIVGHSPIPGLMAPTYLCGKLAYKLMTYKVACGEGLPLKTGGSAPSLS